MGGNEIARKGENNQKKCYFLTNAPCFIVKCEKIVSETCVLILPAYLCNPLNGSRLLQSTFFKKWFFFVPAFLVIGFSYGFAPENKADEKYFLVGESKEKFLTLFNKGRSSGYFYYGELCKQLLPELAGLPYGAGNVSCPGTKTLVNFQSFDCVTLVESWWAMSQTLFQFHSGKVKKEADPLEVFVTNLNKIRYFGGENCGISYRIHYFTQQMLELERCGYAFNVAQSYGVPFDKKIDYITQNSESFGDFVDTEMFKSFEAVLNSTDNYFYPMNKVSLYYPMAQDGDLIAFATNEDGLDVSHTGIVTVEDGEARLTHASSKYNRVMYSQSLDGYLKSRTTITGIFVFRPVFE
jgi:Protein of unknown function (DUF1460)